MSRGFLLILLGVAIIIAIGYARAYYEDYTVRREITRLQEEVKALEKKKFASLELLQYARSENFLEDKARTELNLKKEGERVLVIPGIEPAPPKKLIENITPERVDTKPLSNPVKWWYYFLEHNLPN